MIVPSIDIAHGRAVQLRRGEQLVLDGGDPLERLEAFSVVGEVAVVDLDAAKGEGTNAELIREMVRRAPCRVGGGIRTLDAARQWLDWGARKIVLGTAASEELCGALPRDRVVVALDAKHGEVMVEGWKTPTGRSVAERLEELAPVAAGCLVTQIENEGMLGGIDVDAVAALRRLAPEVAVTAAGGITTVSEVRALDRLGVDAQVGMSLYTNRMDLGEGFAAGLREPTVGGYWPTVVCDEDGSCLGLVWSTLESLRRAVAERRGIYWSRSRNEIWVKGASSGNTQVLLRAELDCDRDAIRFVVRQEGAGFCHRGTWTCWPDRFGLADLERTIAGRIDGSDPESGTAKLLADSALLEAKLAEEAAELARSRSPDSAVHEMADLLYFGLVALKENGGTLAEVVRELEHRSLRVRRRPMRANERDGRA